MNVRWPVALAFIIVMTLLFITLRLESRGKKDDSDKMPCLPHRHWHTSKEWRTRGVILGICSTCAIQEDPEEAHRLIKEIIRREGGDHIKGG